jgi:hypothetical protein
MTTERRLAWLKIGAAAVVGLLVADRVILTPMIGRWQTQGERIAEYRKKVQEGRHLLGREEAIRERWAAMVREDLPPDVAAAENELFQAVARWAGGSRVTFTGLNPQWHQQEGYEALECRASATGDQVAMARFLSALESDPLAVRMEACEISSRDAQGRQLTLNARFSALRLLEPEREGP